MKFLHLLEEPFAIHNRVLCVCCCFFGGWVVIFFLSFFFPPFSVSFVLGLQFCNSIFSSMLRVNLLISNCLLFSVVLVVGVEGWGGGILE